MSLSIGLEALNRHNGGTVGSFESSYANFMEAYAVLQEELTYGEQLFTALENLSAIRKTVKRFGFTKSMESLVGHQLGSTTAQISMEAETVQRSTWEKIVDWFKKIWRYIKDFFAKAFNTRRGLMMKLKEIVDNKKSYKVRDEAKTFEGYALSDIPSGDKLKDDLADLKEIKLTDNDIGTYATKLLASLESATKTEANILNGIKNGIALAQRGINDPQADIDTVREKQKNASTETKMVSKNMGKLFKCARNFFKYIKKS